MTDPAAPRGVPQIEVTFDIDANGIVTVSAKDRGTGKEQHITITSSTNMSKEDIDKAVKEAEKYAEEDRKFKETIDLKNHADSLIAQCEKTLTELGDKVSESEKTEINAEIEKLRSASASENTEEMKAGIDSLQKVFGKVSERIYQQTGGADGANGADQANGGQNSDGSFDADFTDKTGE